MIAQGLHAVLRALTMAAAMGWSMLWALILGFFVSGAIQAVVSHKDMARLLPDDSTKSVLKAAGLGAASSSCSYAAAAIARSIVLKGGDFKAAMVFQFASTNLVLELGLILATLIGWRFTAATWAGGVVMILLLVPLLRLMLRKPLLDAAQRQAERGATGRMEGHAKMNMAVADGPLLKRLFSAEGFTAASHYFVMDWASLYIDLIGGLVIAGAIGAWVPQGVWSHAFFAGQPWASRIAGPLIGPLVAIFTFVCSVGNVPLAAVLWNGGASFGGVIAFLFADLIVLPLLDIYRRYYGWKVAAVLALAFYLAMAGAAYVVEGLFALLHLTPTMRDASMAEIGFSLNYTTCLNAVSLVLAAALVWRFLATGGPKMLKMMG
jgi:uncharacterized membrane protein YraQ (UPF0718 family)